MDIGELIKEDNRPVKILVNEYSDKTVYSNVYRMTKTTVNNISSVLDIRVEHDMRFVVTLYKELSKLKPVEPPIFDETIFVLERQNKKRKRNSGRQSMVYSIKPDVPVDNKFIRELSAHDGIKSYVFEGGKLLIVKDV